MLPNIIISLALLATCVVAQPHDILISTYMSRQTANSPPKDCNTTCDAFKDVHKACNFKHCGCNTIYLQAQGDCLLCQTDTPPDEASVQFFLDAEMSQCHEEGIAIKFKLHLPPAAQAIVDDINRQSAHLRQRQMVFLALQIVGGHFGLVILLCHAVFSRKINRDPTFINFCITWIFSSVVYSISLYRGTEGNTIEALLGRINSNVCLMQGVLTNGAQAMTACSTMALVIQLWLGLRAAIRRETTKPKQRQRTKLVLLIMPYVFFCALAIPSIFVGKIFLVGAATTLQRVQPTNFYCSVVTFDSILQAVYGTTLGLLVVAAVFDVLILNILYRHWTAFHHVQSHGVVSLSVLLRVIMFSIYRIVVAVAYSTVLANLPQVRIRRTFIGDSVSLAFGVQPWVDMLQAAIPLVASIILGLNTDMVASLMFWRKNKGTLPSMMSNATNTNGARPVQASQSTKRSELATTKGDTKNIDDLV